MMPSKEVARQRLKFERTPVRRALVAAYLATVLLALILFLAMADHLHHKFLIEAALSRAMY